MDFSLDELNELYYCVGTALAKGILVNRQLSVQLFNRIGAEIENRNDEPEYDSAGFTEADRVVDGQYQNKELFDWCPPAVQRWG